MSSAIPTDKEIIADLGGPAALAELGYSAYAVKKWMQRGIPWKARAKVAKFAQQKRKWLPPDFLQERRAA
jgi:hypothetical protein